MVLSLAPTPCALVYRYQQEEHHLDGSNQRYLKRKFISTGYFTPQFTVGMEGNRKECGNEEPKVGRPNVLSAPKAR
jgi:hypothetical protein